jgi:hypothetical protein
MSEDNNNSIYRLVNPEFDFEFVGTVYHLRKATLDKAVSYQEKIKSLGDKPGAELELIAFCVSLMLRDQDPTITEEYALQHLPADIDVLEVLTFLGFMNPSKQAKARQIETLMMNRLTGENSSA